MTSSWIYPLATVALFYLGSQAMITKWLWSRYPRWLDELAQCSACSGFWLGILVALAGGFALDLPFAGLPAHAWYTPPIVGLCAIVWTPLIADLHIRALLRLGGSDAQEEER